MNKFFKMTSKKFVAVVAVIALVAQYFVPFVTVFASSEAPTNLSVTFHTNDDKNEGKVQYSKNGGTTWIDVTDDLNNLSIEDLDGNLLLKIVPNNGYRADLTATALKFDNNDPVGLNGNNTYAAITSAEGYSVEAAVRNVVLSGVEFAEDNGGGNDPQSETFEVSFDNVVSANNNVLTFNVDNTEVTAALFIDGTATNIQSREDQDVTVYYVVIDRNDLDKVEFTLTNFDNENMTAIMRGAGEWNFPLAYDDGNNKISFNSMNAPGDGANLAIESNNGNPGDPGNQDTLEIQFDNVKAYTANSVTFDLDDKEVTATMSGVNAEISHSSTYDEQEHRDIESWRFEIDRSDLNNLSFTISDNFNSDTMEIKIIGASNYQHTFEVDNNQISFAGVNFNDWVHFVIQYKNTNPDPGDPQGNKTATLRVKGGEGSFTTGGQTKYYKDTYTDARFAVNGGNVRDLREEDKVKEGNNVLYSEITLNYEEDSDETIDIAFSTLFIQKYVGNIKVNGNNYDVSEYIDYTNRTNWLNHYGNQELSFTVTVPKAADDIYNIEINLEPMEGEHQYIGNFLWTGDESQSNNDNYIGHSRLELVKVQYEVDNHVYVRDFTNEDDLALMDKGENEQGPDRYYRDYADDYLEYGKKTIENNQPVTYDEGSLVVPDGALVTMRIVPEYGYQVTSFAVNGDDIITGDNISEFTFEIHKGNFHLGANVTAVDDEVKSESDSVSSGNILIANDEIDSGTVQLSVDDAQIDNAKQAAFEENAEGYDIQNYLDIKLDQVFYKGTAENVWKNSIEDLNNDATISLQLAEGIDPDDTVLIHNIHNGDDFEEIEIADYDAETNTITFRTNSFSTYAIAVLNTEDLPAADYSAFDEAISAAQQIDTSVYTPASVARLQAAIDAAEAMSREYKSNKQNKIDEATEAINNAVNTLVYKKADYSAIDAALEAVEALDRDIYTAASLTALEEAISAVVTGKNITQQASVDKMAKAINDALKALEKKAADTTALQAAIARANELDKTAYPEENVNAIEAAVSAAENLVNAKIDEQDKVDAATTAIDEAIAAAEEAKTPKTEEENQKSKVEETQKYLNEKYGVDISTDGVADKKTIDALVKAIQTELNEEYGANLNVDGVYGVTSQSRTPFIVKGAEGDLVVLIQRALQIKGYELSADGDFGPHTEAIVKQYQEANGLVPDGIIGKKTLASLLTPNVLSPEDIQANKVKAVQEYLNSNYTSGLVVDGLAGPKTMAAIVKALQTELNEEYDANLNVDGVYGVTSQSRTPFIQKGATGSIVKLVQMMLQIKGYELNAEGDFDSQTEAIVRQFQTDNELSIDGAVGPKTMAKLVS